MNGVRSTSGMERRLVLVADDEPAIRVMLARVLVKLGFVPLLVGDGVAAIDAVEAHGSELVSVIMDVAMPGGNGIDAAHVIQRIAPDVPITLMSGAVPTTYAGRITRLRLAGLLQKPFPLATLRALLPNAVADGIAHEQRREVANAQP